MILKVNLQTKRDWYESLAARLERKSFFEKKDWERKTEIAAQKLNVFTSVEIIIFDDGVYKFTFGERNVVSIKF